MLTESSAFHNQSLNWWNSFEKTQNKLEKILTFLCLCKVQDTIVVNTIQQTEQGNKRNTSAFPIELQTNKRRSKTERQKSKWTPLAGSSAKRKLTDARGDEAFSWAGFERLRVSVCGLGHRYHTHFVRGGGFQLVQGQPEVIGGPLVVSVPAVVTCQVKQSSDQPDPMAGHFRCCTDRYNFLAG